MIPKFIKGYSVPHKPGIYIFQDRNGKILYVGKAIDLHSRVNSYFSGHHLPKTVSLVAEIANIETVIVESELEALVLEANLIKKYLPPYNVALTDDKDYLYIKITKEDFPRVVLARKKELEDAKKYFGPYPSARTVRDTLKKLRKTFKWCSNPPKYDVDTDTIILKKPCFYYHIKLCLGACIGKISGEDYRKITNRLSLFLEGKKGELLDELEAEMEEASQNLEFEKALELKKIISGIIYLTQPNRVESYLENPNFLKNENRLAILQLMKDLNLKEVPERIEGYDISNIQGKQATGSLVVLTDGEIDKSQYRKFKIQITGKPNDYAMHSEMMGRRLNHLEDWGKPQLIIIDGGRGQVRAALIELEKRGVDIPTFGLAKRLEWLYPPEGEVIKLSKRSLSLRLLQRLRDESHRFAISYHRRLRSRSLGLV